MSENQGVEPVLTTTKILQAAFLVAVVIYAGVLWFLDYSQTIPGVLSGNPILNSVSIVLALVAVLTLALGYYIQKSYGRPRTPQSLLTIVILRAACIESVAIFGLVLGILGATWSVTAWFFIAALAGLIVTFPTRERLADMLR